MAVSSPQVDIVLEARVELPALEDIEDPYIRIDSVVDKAYSYVGTPYVYGGSSASGIDCSGLIRKSFDQISLKLPHSSRGMSEMGTEVDIDSVRTGDLLFFTGRNKNSTTVSHVSLVVSIDSLGIHMAHATRRGVVVDVLQDQTYYTDRFLFARRLDLATL